MNKFPYGHETIVAIHAPAHEVFDYVDDHSRLSSHMTRRSWMMGGASMAIETDSGRARVVGSKLKLHGTVLGIRLPGFDRICVAEQPALALARIAFRAPIRRLVHPSDGQRRISPL